MKFVHLAALFISVYAAGCAAKGNQETVKQEVELPVLKLQTLDTILEKSYVTSINACRNVELRAKAAGFLEEISVDEGQMVQKGQIMFRLNDAEFKVQLTEAKAALSSAQADLKSAGVELDRVKILVTKKVLSASELDLAKAKLAAAAARVDEAAARQENAAIKLSYTVIRAPFTGIIDRIPHKKGSLITEGILLTTVSDIHEMHAYFNLSESEYLNYMKSGKKAHKDGEKVQLVLADGSLYAQQGTIQTIDAEIEKQTGSIAFRASFSNPAQLLKHGASGKIILQSAAPKAILIPQRAVFEIQDKNYVFIVKNDNTVKMQEFKPDTRLDDFVLVQSGLSANDQIIYEGVQNIKEGSRIKPRYIGIDSLLTAP